MTVGFQAVALVADLKADLDLIELAATACKLQSMLQAVNHDRGCRATTLAASAVPIRARGATFHRINGVDA